MTLHYPMRDEILRSSSAGVRNAQLEALSEKQQRIIDALLKTNKKLTDALEVKDRRILELEASMLLAADRLEHGEQ